jgi:hypothetical protein
VPISWRPLHFAGLSPATARRDTIAKPRRDLSALDDLLLRFAALADDSEPVRHVRGVALAVAMEWLIRLQDGPAKDRALCKLSEAAELACEAAAGA